MPGVGAVLVVVDRSEQSFQTYVVYPLVRGTTVLLPVSSTADHMTTTSLVISASTLKEMQSFGQLGEALL